jgi:vancomycin permeability regulator SanA
LRSLADWGKGHNLDKHIKIFSTILYLSCRQWLGILNISKIKVVKRSLIISTGGLLASVFVGTAILVASGLQDRKGHADVALVLGSKVERNGAPSKRLQSRLDRTVELYKEGYFPTVIVSGGLGKEGYDEAAVMKIYLAKNGIPSNRIIMDSNGSTTYASAQNTLRIARQKNFKGVFVISQYFHIPRTVLALNRFGIATVYSAHANIYEFRDIYSSFRELFGYFSYAMRRYDR